MLERYLAKQFDDAFNDYHLLKPRDKLAGWPDRGIQHKNNLYWCELKTTTLRKDGTILLSNFDQHQAIFMYKWQRAGGQCFLVTSIDSNQRTSYAVNSEPVANNWLRFNTKLMALSDFDLVTTNINDVVDWFEHRYIN